MTPGSAITNVIVTRVSKSGDMIWFREMRPDVVFGDSIPVPHRHWPFQNQELVTEDGARVLQANYPGDTMNLGAMGRKLSKADFPDVDNDGRQCVSLLTCGPGDVIETPVQVSLIREGPDTYRLRASVALSLKLPMRTAILGLKRGKKMELNIVPRPQKGFTISEDMLAGAEVYIIEPRRIAH